MAELLDTNAALTFDDLGRAGGPASLGTDGKLLAAQVPDSFASASTLDLKYPLGRWRGALVRRDTTTILFLPAGSSTTFGQAASTLAKSYVYRLTAAIQAAYPKADGTAHPATETGDDSQAIAQPVGIKTINYGKGSTTSSDFISSTQLDKMVTQSKTNGLAHLFWMVGSNDWSRDIRVADFKTKMQAWITQARTKFTAAGKPYVITLVATYGRIDSSAQVAPKEAWPLFVKAMRELAIANPADVAFLDLSETYRAAGLPGTGAAYDPFDLLTTDDVHQNDYGHEFMANELARQLDLPRVAATATTTPVTPTPTTPTYVVASSDDFTGTAAATISGRSTDAKKGGIATAWTLPTPNAYGIDGTTTGNLVPGGTRATVETAGYLLNNLTQALEFKASGLGSGSSFWGELRAESVSTSAIAAYRLRITTGNQVVISKRTAGGGSGTGDLVTATIPGGAAASHVYRFEVYTNAAGNVVLRAYVDGAEIAGSPFIDDTTTKLTTGPAFKLTSTNGTVGYAIDYVTTYTG